MTIPILLTFFKGIGIGAGLIIAIGAQNAFILKNAIIRKHVFTMAIMCSVIDAVMIYLGVSGAGHFISNNNYLLNIAKYGGAAFLFYYGARSFYSALYLKHSIDDENVNDAGSLNRTIVTLLALSFLNPHLYLDTVVLLGSIGAQISENLRIYFTLGAICASFLWFFSLSYGARYLSPLFQKPVSWKILDGIIGVIMWSIAASLLL